ncbi:MAG TPA: hypothetical protein VNO21_05720 [Polyangiaceae bacterium]|nr:hypothetical protein [Polyangiaceae bacterium]
MSEVDTAFVALRALLAEVDAPYKLVGGLAVIHHGYERLTVDIDLLVGREALEAIKARAPEHGFTILSQRRLLHEPTGVRVDLLVAGEPIPRSTDVTFPSPESMGASPHDATFIGLSGLFELKLRSGRNKDLADITELLKSIDDTRYIFLESEVPRELRREFADLRRDALEELAWAEQDAKREREADASHDAPSNSDRDDHGN